MNIEKIKKLREETAVSLRECKKALEQAKGDIGKAKEILKRRGAVLAQKRAERKTGEGIIEGYIHSNSKVGVLVDLRCETDFVARSQEFKELAHELCLQIASMVPENTKSLLSQCWIKDESRTIKDLISEYIAKLGENIRIERFVRYEI